MTEQRCGSLGRKTGAEPGPCRDGGLEPGALHHFFNDETGDGLRCGAAAYRRERFESRDLFGDGFFNPKPAEAAANASSAGIADLSRRRAAWSVSA